MGNFQLLVVDDDDLILQSLRMALPETWSLTGVSNPKELPDKKFHAAFVDMHLTQKKIPEGVDVIRELHLKDPHLEIIAMSGDLDRDLMEKCLKAGAARYLAKPLSTEEFHMILEKIEAWLLLQDASQRRPQNTTAWVGQGPNSQSVKKQIASFKGEKGPLLLEGESGTGKEVAAQLIHSQEPNGRPFITVNVAAIPETLFESEVFGHVKGAFTGADSNKMGLAEAANGGDLFLDEIEALSLPLQAKLLRFLESGEIRRVGSQNPIHVDVRVIVATNQNLNQMVKEEKFREDLLWRLSGKKLTLPPLRERTEDLKELCEYFLSLDSSRKKTLDEDALDAMKNYSWPGNIRELRRVSEQLILMAPLPMIRRQDIQGIIQPRTAVTKTNTTIDFSKGLSALMEEYESLILQKSLEKFNDVDEASRALKVSRSNLYKKIKDHKIDWRST